MGNISSGMEAICKDIVNSQEDRKKSLHDVKKDVKDLRKSPALDIIEILQKKNMDISYFDPLIPYLKINHINLKSIDLSIGNLNKFHCVVIVTDHSAVDYDFILRNSKLIFDTRNVYKDCKNSKVIKL